MRQQSSIYRPSKQRQSKIYLPFGDVPPWGAVGGGSWRFCSTLAAEFRKRDVFVSNCLHHRYDVAICLAWYPSVSAVLWLRLLGAKILHRVCQSTSDSVHRTNDLEKLKRINRLSDITVYCSEFVRSWMSDAGWAEASGTIIGNAVDTMIFCPEGPRLDFVSPSLVAVGWSTSTFKGMNLLRCFVDTPLNVYLCGRFSAEIYEMAKQSSNFRVVSPPPTDATNNASIVAGWMRSADVLFFPSIGEGFGNVVAEALCCGTPVYAGKNGGAVPEIIGKHGKLYDQPVVEDVLQLIRDSSDRNDVAAHARSKFDVRSIADQYLALMDF